MLRGVDFVTSQRARRADPALPGRAPGSMQQFPFGPMSGAAANITLLSYLDELHIGINIDPAAVPDPETFVECLQEGFDEILKC